MKEYIILFISISLLLIGTINIKALPSNDLEVNKIGIDIKGAVKNPGYYQLDYNSTVYDAILISGGLISSASTEVTNLSKKLQDEDTIIIYTIDEVNSMLEDNGAIKIIEKECMCPKIENVSLIDKAITNVKNEDKINLNTATKEQLMTLSGIGEAKANSIIAYRDVTPFTDIKDIMNIKGIGNSIFEKIKDYITV